jgi:hypothetical protein
MRAIDEIEDTIALDTVMDRKRTSWLEFKIVSDIGHTPE